MKPGDTIGPYVVDSLLAEGGMGSVFRACNRVTGQFRAVKVVRAAFASDRDFVERFVREASIASQLRHPNLVETLEPGIDKDTIYLPMELLEGEPLSQRLARARQLPAAEVAAVLSPVCEAVQLLHDRGIVHRDLKPSNIFLQRSGALEIPKVIDLGTARDVRHTEHTQTGVLVGTLSYMALEQVEGRKDIDGRADQYALGVVAYEMLTGACPYEDDDTSSAMVKMLRGVPGVAPSFRVQDLPPELEAVVVRALALDREQRYPTIADFSAALSAACSAPARAVGPGTKATLATPIRAVRSSSMATRVATPSTRPSDALTPTAVHTPRVVSAAPALAPPPPSTPASLSLPAPTASAAIGASVAGVAGPPAPLASPSGSAPAPLPDIPFAAPPAAVPAPRVRSVRTILAVIVAATLVAVLVSPATRALWTRARVSESAQGPLIAVPSAPAGSAEHGAATSVPTSTAPAAPSPAATPPIEPNAQATSTVTASAAVPPTVVASTPSTTAASPTQAAPRGLSSTLADPTVIPPRSTVDSTPVAGMGATATSSSPRPTARTAPSDAATPARGMPGAGGVQHAPSARPARDSEHDQPCGAAVGIPCIE
uniref:serine/threonine-protein kinase n=1 Tax=Sandaracinus sp. TaxID=2024858 RepID=UPI0019D43898|nr:serine/threonine-protein kinase [Sandaracinus sp.]QRN75738.1 Serine/threonine protein kinase [Sandaracinus sp.]